MRRSVSLSVLIACMLVSGCGGPSQTALDQANRETAGLASSNKLSEISIPEHAFGDADHGNIDSYGVQLDAPETKRPDNSSDSSTADNAGVDNNGYTSPPKAAQATQPKPVLNTADSEQLATVPIDPADSGLQVPPGLNAVAAANLKPMEIKPLTIGDAAPQLQIDSWLKGSPAESFDSQKVYVVEFWATWCGPCKMNMPHLSDLQRQFENQVQFIGISDETPAKIKAFFESEAAAGKTWDDVLQYTIAADAGQSTKMRYMQAAGERGIPCAFIVGKDQTIQWIGHPARIDEPLAEIVQGNWDVAQARLQRETSRRYDQAFAALRTRMGGWIKSKDFDSALGAIEALSVEFPERDEPLIIKLEVLRASQRFNETYPVIGKLVERKWDDPNMLSQLAWLIAAETTGPDRDLELALKAALRSAEVTNQQAPIALDTVARVYFEQGDIENAIAWQTKAVALGGKFEADMQKTLENYQQAAK